MLAIGETIDFNKAEDGQSFLIGHLLTEGPTALICLESRWTAIAVASRETYVQKDHFVSRSISRTL